MKKEYLCVKNFIESELIIEKSKFICSIKEVHGEQQAKEFISEVRKKYSDATHNCYAYIADENGLSVKFSDDGEPQGTAGMPILEMLKGRKLFCVAAVVTRYFGGVKLGAGGLVRAYSECVGKGIDKAGVFEYVNSVVLSCQIPFALYPKINKFLSSIKSKILSVEYTAFCVDLTFAVPIDFEGTMRDKIADFSAGKTQVKTIKNGFIAY